MNNDEIIGKAMFNIKCFDDIETKEDIMNVMREAMRRQAQQIFKELEEEGTIQEENGYYFDLQEATKIKKKWCEQ